MPELRLKVKLFLPLTPILTDNRHIPHSRGAHAPPRVVFGALAEHLWFPRPRFSRFIVGSGMTPIPNDIRRNGRCRAMTLTQLACGKQVTARKSLTLREMNQFTQGKIKEKVPESVPAGLMSVSRNAPAVAEEKVNWVYFTKPAS